LIVNGKDLQIWHLTDNTACQSCQEKMQNLPTSILEHVFAYLRPEEILQSFLQLTVSIDQLVRHYTNYRVNLHNILRNDFDLLCQCIRADQIYALTLSEDFGSQLYLQRYSIENNWMRLRALRLMGVVLNEPIDAASLQMIDTDHLANFSWISTLVSLKRLIVRNPLETLFQLDVFFVDELLSRLTQLTIDFCSFTLLHRILRRAQQLVTLTIGLRIFDCASIDGFIHDNDHRHETLQSLTISVDSSSKCRSLE
jgi:hypothetical protein